MIEGSGAGSGCGSGSATLVPYVYDPQQGITVMSSGATLAAATYSAGGSTHV
jgi:hypothetical protein